MGLRALSRTGRDVGQGAAGLDASADQVGVIARLVVVTAEETISTWAGGPPEPAKRPTERSSPHVLPLCQIGATWERRPDSLCR
jgi:hypothetical protein